MPVNGTHLYPSFVLAYFYECYDYASMPNRFNNTAEHKSYNDNSITRRSKGDYLLDGSFCGSDKEAILMAYYLQRCRCSCHDYCDGSCVCRRVCVVFQTVVRMFLFLYSIGMKVYLWGLPLL